jgi:hypothetical protein
MKEIETIDLWTEAFANHYECFNGAFIDGFENNVSPPPIKNSKLSKIATA